VQQILIFSQNCKTQRGWLTHLPYRNVQNPLAPNAFSPWGTRVGTECTTFIVLNEHSHPLRLHYVCNVINNQQKTCAAKTIKNLPILLKIPTTDARNSLWPCQCGFHFLPNYIFGCGLLLDVVLEKIRPKHNGLYSTSKISALLEVHLLYPLLNE